MAKHSEVAEPKDRSLRHEEAIAFLFLAVVLWPVLAVTAVGGFGFVIWMYQLIAGPPTY